MLGLMLAAIEIDCASACTVVGDRVCVAGGLAIDLFLSRTVVVGVRGVSCSSPLRRTHRAGVNDVVGSKRIEIDAYIILDGWRPDKQG